MDERAVRDRSAVILEAYRELSGSSEELSIRDFLLIREAARAETGTAPTPARAAPREEVPVRKKTPAKKKDAPKTDVPEKAPLPENKADRKPEPEPVREKSDFEILAGLKDPWN